MCLLKETQLHVLGEGAVFVAGVEILPHQHLFHGALTGMGLQDAALLLDVKIPALAGQVRIPADDVCLKPSLIENNVSKRNRVSAEGGDING